MVPVLFPILSNSPSLTITESAGIMQFILVLIFRTGDCGFGATHRAEEKLEDIWSYGYLS